ncbi:MAG: glycine cleavage system protein GcvH [Anaerolineales bacterium]|jgi:glycine cleavage system H protein
MEFPADLKYTENDEWIKVEGTQGTVGITDWAQDQLSDIVYVEIIADLGETVPKGETFASVESVKAAADVYMPVTGKLIEGNEALADTPEMVNTDPYGAAWMGKIEIADPAELDGLLDAAAYQKHCEERES